MISDFQSDYFLEVMIKRALHKIGKTLSGTEVLEHQGALNDYTCDDVALRLSLPRFALKSEGLPLLFTLENKVEP